MFTLVRAAIRFFSERYGGRPYIDCLICAIMVVLRWMGYNVKDGDQKTIRAAMPGSPPAGTSIAQNMAALKALALSILPHAAKVDQEFILSNLKVIGARGRGKSVFAVILYNQHLPAGSWLRNLTGRDYVGLHAITVVAKSADNNYLYVLNPMGRDAAHPPKGAGPDWEPYTGQLVPASDIWGAALRKEGRLPVVYGARGEAHKSTTTP